MQKSNPHYVQLQYCTVLLLKEFRCMRTWVPIFFQPLEVARTNSYVLWKQKGKTTTHKQFVMDWIDDWNKRASQTEARTAREAAAAAASALLTVSSVRT
jgi:hypothetical protein